MNQGGHRSFKITMLPAARLHRTRENLDRQDQKGHDSQRHQRESRIELPHDDEHGDQHRH